MPISAVDNTIHVSFVIAATNDADLLTVRAHRTLGSASLIIADAEVAQLARETGSGEISIATDECGCELPLEQRTALVTTSLQAHTHIVRLLSGDPVLDGRLACETHELDVRGVSFEVLAGVSALTAVPAFLGMSLAGGHTREIHVLDANAPDLDWHNHIDANVTLVIHNAADTAVEVSRQLIRAGRDPQTPVAVVRDGGTVEQRSLYATLGTLAPVVKQAKQSGSGLVIVGERAGDHSSWFENRPLHGWRILIPRTKDSTEQLCRTLNSYGAVTVEVPTMSIEPPRTPGQMERAIHGIVEGRYEWIVFSSVSAVRAIRERFADHGLDARTLSGIRIAAIGADTIEALAQMGVRADLVPESEHTSTGLLEVWPQFDDLVFPFNRVFLPRADIATETLEEGLTNLGWEVEDITAFRTVRAAPPAANIREAIKSGGFDAVVFTSSATVRNLVGIAGKPHSSSIIACIGPLTAKAAGDLGLRVDVQPEETNHESLALALVAHGANLRDAAAEIGAPAWRPSRRRANASRRSLIAKD
jgi:uroporphyrinogen III methyltransferase/synthase